MDDFSDVNRLLYPSQLLRFDKSTINLNTPIDKNLQKKNNNAIVEAILVDGRGYGDFRKNGN